MVTRNHVLLTTILMIGIIGVQIIYTQHGNFIYLMEEEESVEELLQECSEGCHQINEKLVKLIKKQILPPSTLPYNFTKEDPDLKGQIGQAVYVNHLLKDQRNGFFVECGANQGERFSNSLFFEMKRNWTGLLIEADDFSFENLKMKNRKAYALHACLSLEKRSSVVQFLSAHMVGGIVGLPETPGLISLRSAFTNKTQIPVQCYPFYSVLLAMGNPVVDYFSLDVEGAEMDILLTIPWSDVYIRVLTIEYNSDLRVKKKMTEFMYRQGYKYVAQIAGQDLVFVHKNAGIK